MNLNYMDTYNAVTGAVIGLNPILQLNTPKMRRCNNDNCKNNTRGTDYYIKRCCPDI